MGYYKKLTSAIYNDTVSGLRGYGSNSSISMEQIEDDIIDERLQIIKEYNLKGLIPKTDLLMSINCIKTDCKSIESCNCFSGHGTPTIHFEIPQILSEVDGGIEYIGTTDKTKPFMFYTSLNAMQYHKYTKRAKRHPYVYVDVTPNSNNMCDCFIFNAPLIQSVSIIAIFKDPRQLEFFGCCSDLDINNMTFIDCEIKKRLTEKKLRYYRNFAETPTPNNQTPK